MVTHRDGAECCEVRSGELRPINSAAAAAAEGLDAERPRPGAGEASSAIPPPPCDWGKERTRGKNGKKKCELTQAS